MYRPSRCFASQRAIRHEHVVSIAASLNQGEPQISSLWTRPSIRQDAISSIVSAKAISLESGWLLSMVSFALVVHATHRPQLLFLRSSGSNSGCFNVSSHLPRVRKHFMSESDSTATFV